MIWRASKIAFLSWCEEKALLMLLKKIERKETQEMRRGTFIHEKLNFYRLEVYKPYSKILKKLSQFLVKVEDRETFTREFSRNLTLSGTPDFFVLRYKREVEIHEDKTISSFKIPRFSLPCHVLQLESYCFIMNPLFEKIGYKLAPSHQINYIYSRTGEIFETRRIQYNEEEFIERLNRAYNLSINLRNPIPPKPWKCYSCEGQYRRKCRIFPLFSQRGKRKRDFKKLYDWGEEWEYLLRLKLLQAGHLIINEKSKDFFHPILGALRGIDFVCLKCGAWFEAKRRSKNELSINKKDIEIYKEFDPLLCFKTPRREFYVSGKEIALNEKKGVARINKYGEKYIRFPKLEVFKTLSYRVPRCGK